MRSLHIGLLHLNYVMFGLARKLYNCCETCSNTHYTFLFPYTLYLCWTCLQVYKFSITLSTYYNVI